MCVLEKICNGMIFTKSDNFFFIGIVDIRGLNLAAVKHTTVQVSRLPL
jgi:hypothetical protein